MTALRNIMSVAHYERIMLARTTRFRFLGLVGIAIPMFFGVVLAIAEVFGEVDEGASVFGLSAFVPFYFYTYTQTVLTAFVAGNFRAADEHAGVGEVIAARPMSTTQIVIGKYLGVLQALAGLSALVALLTMGIQAAKLSLVGAPFIFAPYAYYFFLMMLPALIFMSALTFSLGVILRNRTAVALLSVGYVLTVLFYLGTRYGGIFDFGAFFAPLFYSDMLGVWGGWFVTVRVYGVSSWDYWNFTQSFVGWWEPFTGLVKSVFFGLSIGLIACYNGFHSRPGAAGVGRAATDAFVQSFLAIIVLNLLLAKLLNTIHGILF